MIEMLYNEYLSVAAFALAALLAAARRWSPWR